MKKFINSKSSRKFSPGFSVFYAVIAVCFATLILISVSSFTERTFVSVVLTAAVFLSLIYYTKKYYDRSGIVSYMEKLMLSLLFVAFAEILCEFFGRNLFTLFFIIMPLVYAYAGRFTCFFLLFLISAIELNIERDAAVLLKLLPLALSTVVFGSFIRGEQHMEGRLKENISALLGSKGLNTAAAEKSSGENRIQSAITRDLQNLSRFLPYNSIVLYIRNDEGLYEIYDFISKNEEVIDRSQKLNFRSGYIGWTVKTKTPFMIGNIKNPSDNITYYNREIDIRSLIIIPLTENTSTGDKEKDTPPNGILVVDSRESDAFDNQNKLISEIVAGRINSLISVYNLQNSINENSDRLNSIYRYIQHLETSMDPGTIIENLFKTLRNSIQSDLICISRKSDGSSKIVACGSSVNGLDGKIFSHSQSLMGIVSENNTPLNLSDISDRSKYRDVFNKEIDLGLGMGSVKSSMLFPLSPSYEKNSEEIYGAVFFGNIRNDEFNDEQRNLAKLLIQQAAKSIQYSDNLRNVKELAIKDGLSGLYNQKHFKEMLLNAVAKSQRFDELFSLVLLDIDDFKEINDRFGHLAGDRIISQMGKTLQENLREVDLCARYGGDEFAVLLEKTDADGALVAAEKIVKYFESRPVMYNNEKIQVKLSVGIATCPLNADSADELIEKADHSLYEAKKSGKNRVVHFSDIDKPGADSSANTEEKRSISREDQ